MRSSLEKSVCRTAYLWPLTGLEYLKTMARFRLRMHHGDQLAVRRGHHRSRAGCYLRVDEPMVSRRHARLRITQNAVILRIWEPQWLSRQRHQCDGYRRAKAGDILGVGTQQFTLSARKIPRRTVPRSTSRRSEPAQPTRHGWRHGLARRRRASGESRFDAAAPALWAA